MEFLNVRMYRLVKGNEFLEKFESDRSHMLLEEGEYRFPPPPWPSIQNEGYFLDEF